MVWKLQIHPNYYKFIECEILKAFSQTQAHPSFQKKLLLALNIWNVYLNFYNDCKW